jgi:oligopeptide transport system permease protein
MNGIHRTTSQGPWQSAWGRFKRNRVGLFSLAIVMCFLLVVAATKANWLAQHWQHEVAVRYANPTFLGPTPTQEPASSNTHHLSPRVDLSAIDPLAPRYDAWVKRASQLQVAQAPVANTLVFGADRLGRSVLDKAIKGAEVSIFVGVSAAFLATVIGTFLGALAGFFGRWWGDVLEWVYNVFTSIPSILLIFAFAAVLGRGTHTVVLILGFTGWTGTYRLVRAEFLKHRTRDYVRAAQAIGASNASRIFKHILPNVSHVVVVQLSILVVGCIKAEVILSYLGLGVAVDEVSWGSMLADAQSELLLGYWWQLASATLLMALFVTAFSMLTDALRDALDPKLQGSGLK